MPICQSCGKEWSWTQSMRFQFSLKCPFCKRNQYITKTSRNRTMVFNFSPVIILLISLFFDLSWSVILTLFISVPAIAFSIYPFMIKLSNEEELPWT